MTIDLKTALLVVVLVFIPVCLIGSRRRAQGMGQLLARYRCRAFRSVPLSELHPGPWADRPYLVFRPEDVLT